MPFLMPTYRDPDFRALALTNVPDAKFVPVEKDGVAPRGFHSTSMHPEYFKVNGTWQLARHMMMDDVVRLEADGSLTVLPARDLHVGDLVAAIGSEGQAATFAQLTHSPMAGSPESATTMAVPI